MARKPRIHYPAALYHVILRGNEGQEIFFWKEDCFRFYLLLQEGIEHYGYQIHAFCLMTNHVQPFEIDSRILGDRTFIDKVLAGQG